MCNARLMVQVVRQLGPRCTACRPSGTGRASSVDMWWRCDGSVMQRGSAAARPQSASRHMQVHACLTSSLPAVPAAAATDVHPRSPAALSTGWVRQLGAAAAPKGHAAPSFVTMEGFPQHRAGHLMAAAAVDVAAPCRRKSRCCFPAWIETRALQSLIDRVLQQAWPVASRAGLCSSRQDPTRARHRASLPSAASLLPA